jgi:hypothetical protein
MLTSRSWSRGGHAGGGSPRGFLSGRWFAALALGFIAGSACVLAFQGLRGGFSAGDGSGRQSSESFLSVVRQASADLEEGDYAFLPNRRSIWVVNRTNGRMANYVFRDDEVGSVDRSRVTQMDTQAFPRKDTVLLLSDRNLNNILWACNVRTGDVQMWHVGRDGNLKAEAPTATSADLRDKAP